MRRYLLLPLAALFAAGCGFSDCSVSDFNTLNAIRTVEAAVVPADTLTVLFDADEALGIVEVWIRLEAQTPSEGAEASVTAEVEYGGYDAREVPLFEGEARGDTLVVPLARQAGSALARAAGCDASTESADGALVRPVCSLPQEYYRLFVLGVQAPPGTRAVRYLIRDGRGLTRSLRPAGAAPPHARGARTVRG